MNLRVYNVEIVVTEAKGFTISSYLGAVVKGKIETLVVSGNPYDLTGEGCVKLRCVDLSATDPDGKTIDIPKLDELLAKTKVVSVKKGALVLKESVSGVTFSLLLTLTSDGEIRGEASATGSFLIRLAFSKLCATITGKQTDSLVEG